MPEIQKYSYVESLKEADQKYDNSIALAGPSNLTFFSSNNAMRTVMFTGHLKQFLNLVDPEYPLIYTNMENLVGEYSTGYKKVKHDSILYRKISKFGDILDTPRVHTIFLYDKKKDKYTVEEVKTVEDLVESFGYEYDTEVIDNLNDGDEIPADTVLYKSRSYDDNMNYRYGKNIVTMYSLDPYTSEDAAVASRSLTEKLTSTEVETITIKLNDNDFLLNLRGSNEEYKPLPDIGEQTSGHLAVIRRLFNDQIMFDFKNESLRQIHEGDERIILPSGLYTIEDYTIYSNNEEIDEDNPFTEQINRYLKAQNEYYEAILETCEEIIDSGSEYSKDIDYLYKRSKEMLDSVNKKWKEGDNAFSNLQIEVKVSKRALLARGTKVTGRYGNKSVISQIREDEDMPVTEDGRRVDLILNLLAIINRTTAFVLYELAVNSINYQVRRKMASMKTLKQKATLLFDVLNIYNDEECAIFKDMYDKMDNNEKKAFIQETIDNGILVHQQPMFEKESMFFRISKLLDKYDWLGPETVYVNALGRRVKMLRKQWIGEMYIIKLKQNDRRGFSARSTGAVDARNLPSRSFNSRDHREQFSDKDVRFGEFETYNFSIGTPSEDIALFHALYRTSSKAREDIVKMAFKNPGDMDFVSKIDTQYNSIVAEIFQVFLKSLSIELEFVNPEDDVKTYSIEEEGVYTYRGRTYICSEYQFELFKRICEVKDDIMEECPFMSKDDLMNEIREKLKSGRYVIGPTDLDECELIDYIL